MKIRNAAASIAAIAIVLLLGASAAQASRRTGPYDEIRAAAAPALADTWYTTTAFKAGGNSVSLFCVVSVASAGTVSWKAARSQDASTYYTQVRDTAGAAEWAFYGAATGNYIWNLYGLDVTPGDYVQLSFKVSTITSAPKLACYAMSYDSDTCGGDVYMGAIASSLSTIATSVATTPAPATLGAIYYSFQDASFVTGDSPQISDINAKLGRNSVSGYICNDDSADYISFEISQVAATTYLDAIVLLAGDCFALDGLNVDKIRVTWNADAAYRVFAI